MRSENKKNAGGCIKCIVDCGCNVTIYKNGNWTNRTMNKLSLACIHTGECTATAQISIYAHSRDKLMDGISICVWGVLIIHNSKVLEKKTQRIKWMYKYKRSKSERNKWNSSLWYEKYGFIKVYFFFISLFPRFFFIYHIYRSSAIFSIWRFDKLNHECT